MLLVLLLVLAGSSAAQTGSTKDVWKRNGVLCFTTGKGNRRGVACTLNGKRLAIVNQEQIVVGAPSGVLFATRSH